MNIKSIHTEQKAVSAKRIFSTTEGAVTAMQITAGAVLPDHVTKVPALLICINGKSIFKNEKGLVAELQSGDMINIEPNVVHSIEAIQESQLVLIK